MKKILIVDDSEDIVTMIKDLFIEKGFAVFSATTVQEGLSIAEKKKPDLIITDIVMPELDGYEFIKKLKSCALTREIPVFFLTAKAEKEEMNNSVKAGAVHYILKPFRAKKLVQLVIEHFQNCGRDKKEIPER